ncbi:ABC transporter substrate-binding protein [Haloglycomyces albus]|uniref:ABC transporter substrate-binding protein n=1 Tax=Haloglycomyces albus TaxID=526067 RepID=UPI00046D14F5|nr:ABC transporter substrate-binding protein [Haloglycomyces albus]
MSTLSQPRSDSLSRKGIATLSAAAIIGLSACGTDPEASSSPDTTTIDNCGVEVSATDVPERVVTMNQAATEIMLALGLEDHLIGTAYLDDAIHPDLADAYADVPVLAEQYPSKEVLYDVEPDFVYGSYESAFNDDAAGSRDDLTSLGIASYLSPSSCMDRPMEISDVHGEITDIAALFDITEQGEKLVSDQQTTIDQSAASLTDADLTVLWWDNKLDSPSVGACCGTPAMLMNSLGLDNGFSDVEGSWAEVNWENIIEIDPDVIVAVDAEWSPATEKIDKLHNDPALNELSAVQDDTIVTIPFSATTAGFRNAEAIADLSEQIAAVL